VRAAARGYTTHGRGSPPRVKSADGATDLRAARGAEEFDVSKCRRSILNGECNVTRDAGQIANENRTLINFMRSCCTCEEQGGLGHGAKGIMAGARQRCTTQSRIQSSDKGHRRRWARLYRLVRENERGSEKGAAGDMHDSMSMTGHFGWNRRKLLSVSASNTGGDRSSSPCFCISWACRGRAGPTQEGDEINRPTETTRSGRSHPIWSDRPKIRHRQR
jgi:hypothetical protein